MKTIAPSIPGQLQQDDTLVSSNRQLSAPADLERSRRRASTPRQCHGCGGPWGRELRGGPLVHHTFDCTSVPRPFQQNYDGDYCPAPACCGGTYPYDCIYTP